MKLSKLRIRNFRSIVDTGEMRIGNLQSFVGENNCGKSNILRAIDVFLSAGAGGIQDSNFHNKEIPIIITASFSNLSVEEKKALKIYLIGEDLILEKQISLQTDVDSGKVKVQTEYHGYQAKPKDWWLSSEGVIDHEGTNRPNWKKIAEEHGLMVNIKVEEDGKNISKAAFEKILQEYLQGDIEIEYDYPVLGNSQALGIQQNLLRYLPRFYLLAAITDYSSEIDKRSSTTIFRRLMADLADRILIKDERYTEIVASLEKIRNLLNSPIPGVVVPDGHKRLSSLESIELGLTKNISQLMPSVEGIQLEVELDDMRDFFSRGVSLKVNDGVLTDVLQKGHGLQRSVVFGLLKMLIESQRSETNSIILAIEEPELYIHPQMQRLIFSVLRNFSQTDQVIYSTHSSSFIDISEYNSIALVRKNGVAEGTKVCQCAENVFGTPDERSAFKLLNSFGLAQNQVFFARRSILVEGDQDLIAVISTGRKLKIFTEYPEEIGWSIIVVGNKGSIPKFQKVLNSFSIPYVVLHELDGKDDANIENKAIVDELGTNTRVVIPNKLESLVGMHKHFDDTFHAKHHFSDPDKITADLEKVVADLFA